MKTLATKVGDEVGELFAALAKRRGMTKSLLLRRLVEDAVGPQAVPVAGPPVERVKEALTSLDATPPTGRTGKISRPVVLEKSSGGLERQRRLEAQRKAKR